MTDKMKVLLKIVRLIFEIVWIVISSPMTMCVYISVWFAWISITPDILQKPMFLFDYIFGTICFAIMQLVGEYRQEKKNIEYEKRIASLEQTVQRQSNLEQ